MIIIAKNGATKCNWVLTRKPNNKVTRFRTKGLNTAVLREKELHTIISNEVRLINDNNAIREIYFFGAGCNKESNNQVF